jgi:hypothetical protein
MTIVGNKTMIKAFVGVAGIDRLGPMYLINKGIPVERRNNFRIRSS